MAVTQKGVLKHQSYGGAKVRCDFLKEAQKKVLWHSTVASIIEFAFS
jgi:hypothetical protein